MTRSGIEELSEETLRSLLSFSKNPVSNSAQFSAFIFDLFTDLNWAGFYYYNGNALVLGPYQGKVACDEIIPGRGVCGTAFVKRSTLNIPNVHDFKDHIACDSRSNSEIVIPIIKNQNVYGVFDVDSIRLDRFTQIASTLEKLVDVFIQCTDFEEVFKIGFQPI
ncbi:GAF domain-containing protein [Myxococcota bacterium]|nr:GAF domain-containing protein [Myxococcota bacterium]MBU1381115.1 GAF domain-containing protein [Myxococcota bacterium]MBU1496528.1 GAF domain-containing protein [Myxococcota bacterium]